MRYADQVQPQRPLKMSMPVPQDLQVDALPSPDPPDRWTRRATSDASNCSSSGSPRTPRGPSVPRGRDDRRGAGFRSITGGPAAAGFSSGSEGGVVLARGVSGARGVGVGGTGVGAGGGVGLGADRSCGAGFDRGRRAGLGSGSDLGAGFGFVGASPAPEPCCPSPGSMMRSATTSVHSAIGPITRQMPSPRAMIAMLVGIVPKKGIIPKTPTSNLTKVAEVVANRFQETQKPSAAWLRRTIIQGPTGSGSFPLIPCPRPDSSVPRGEANGSPEEPAAGVPRRGAGAPGCRAAGPGHGRDAAVG